MLDTAAAKPHVETTQKNDQYAQEFSSQPPQ